MPPGHGEAPLGFSGLVPWAADVLFCPSWQILDSDGTHRWRHGGSVKLPHGEPGQRVRPDPPVIALAKNRCSLVRPDGTAVHLSPCVRLKRFSGSLEPAGRGHVFVQRDGVSREYEPPHTEVNHGAAAGADLLPNAAAMGARS